MSRPREVLTTGEVAKICNVAPRTVSKWFDSGKLRGYRIPGGKDRRIPLDQLIRFMKSHGIPLDGLETGLRSVLIAEQDAEFGMALATVLEKDPGYQVSVVRSVFEAGARSATETPHVFVVDVSMPGFAGRDAVRCIRNVMSMKDCTLVAMIPGADAGVAESLRQQGFDHVLSKPFKGDDLIAAVGMSAVGSTP